VSDYPVEEFLRGLTAGVAAVGVTLIGAAVAGRLRLGGYLAPIVGLPLAVAALVAIGPSRPPAAGVLIGLIGVTAAATMPWSPVGRRMPVVSSLLLSAPFAWLLAIDASPVGWVRAVVIVGATVGPVAAAHTDVEWGPTGITPALYAVSAAGVFAAVPNTKAAAALLGVSVPAAAAGWPLGRARLGRAGAAGAAALLVWVAAVGSMGREPAILGAVACLGLLVTLPAGRWLAASCTPRQRSSRLQPNVGALSALAAQTAVVAMASRVAGISSELRVAAPAASVAVLAALVVSTMLERGPASAAVTR
jgi:hypothetical protein